MKKLALVLSVFAVAAMCIGIPVAAKRGIGKHDADVRNGVERRHKKELDTLEEKLEKMDEEGEYTIEKEKEYKKTVEELANKELEYEMFDYKEEVEIRLGTVETAVEDMKIAVKKGIPEDKKEDCNNRINKFSVIVEKYNKILDNVKSDEEYEQIAKDLDVELEEIYQEVNN